MATMAAAMGDEFAVTFTQDTASALQYPSTDFDAVVLGRALPPELHNTLQTQLRAANPHLVIVTSLGPVGQLVAVQVKAALFAASGQQPVIQNPRITNSQIVFTTNTASAVAITQYRLNLLFQFKTKQLLDTQLQPGEHVVDMRHGFASKTFVAITAPNNETHLILL